jgi:hypothetical protein
MSTTAMRTFAQAAANATVGVASPRDNFPAFAPTVTTADFGSWLTSQNIVRGGRVQAVRAVAASATIEIRRLLPSAGAPQSLGDRGQGRFTAASGFRDVPAPFVSRLLSARAD